MLEAGTKFNLSRPLKCLRMGRMQAELSRNLSVTGLEKTEVWSCVDILNSLVKEFTQYNLLCYKLRHQSITLLAKSCAF